MIPSRARIIGVLILISAYGALGLDLYLPALPDLGRTFDAGAADVQATLVAYYIGLAFSQAIYGPLTDRFGRKAPLYGGLVVFALSNAGAALAPSLEFVVAMRFFQAIGACAGVVVARAIVRDIFDTRESAHVYSLLMTAFMIVPMLAPLAGSILLDYGGWRLLFWVLGASSTVALVLTFFMLPETLPPSARIKTPPSRILHVYFDILRDRRFLAYGLAAGFSSGILFSYITGTPHVLIDTFGLSPRQFGIVFAVNAFGIMIATFLFNRLTKRISVAQVLHYSYVGHVCAAVAFLGATTTGSLPLILAALFLTIASYGLVTPGNVSLAMEGQGTRAGMASALYGTMQFVFATAITLVLGLVSGPSADAVPLGAVIAASGLLAFLSNRFIAEPIKK